MRKEKNLSLDSLGVNKKINLREMEKSYSMEKGLERKFMKKKTNLKNKERNYIIQTGLEKKQTRQIWKGVTP